jgi:CRISPR/Cas system-associated exonuclease Cas4 (RecB family)
MISLPVISSTSPSLAEAMRGCMLRAGLSRCAQLQPFILGNPKAWLGTAYHKVMEQIPAILGAGGDPLSRADAIWNAEIARLEQEATNHPLNARFGPAVFWKGYFLVQATMRLRIEESVARHSEAPAGAPALPPVAREVEITASQGKLRGKIDMIRGDDLIDYKTGSIFEEDEISGASAVKPAYVRQLRTYAWLARSSTGQWVKRGLLYPLAGAPVEVPIIPAECEVQAAEAVALLDAYNAALTSGAGPAAMASPSPDACRWCPFKPFCSAFWAAVNPDWSGQLDGEAIRATVVAPPQPLLAPGAYSLVVDVQGGTLPPGTSVRLAPLPATVHHSLTGLTAGQPVILTRIGRRANGSLFPLLQTVFLTIQQINAV